MARVVDCTLQAAIARPVVWPRSALCRRFSLTLFDDPPTIDDSPAANAKLIKPAGQQSAEQTRPSCWKGMKSFASATFRSKDYP